MKSDANLLIGEVKGWEEMGGEERGEWMKVMGIEVEKGEGEKEDGKGGEVGEGKEGGGKEGKEGEAVGDLGEGRWMAVRCVDGEGDEERL
jgi:hypothetical protein